MIIQIYEVRTMEAVQAIASMNIDQVGLWATHYPQDTALSFQEARALIEHLPDHMKSVVLTLSHDMEEIGALIQQVNPDILHIGSRPYHFSLDMTRQLKRDYPLQSLMRSIPVGDMSHIELAESYDGIADFLLLDTHDKYVDNFGATGKTHDWDISKKIVEKVNIPVILAGGLGPDNVIEAIHKVRPAGVDSKSNTDIPGTHDKDVEKVRTFVENTRLAEEDLMSGRYDS